MGLWSKRREARSSDHSICREKFPRSNLVHSISLLRSRCVRKFRPENARTLTCSVQQPNRIRKRYETREDSSFKMIQNWRNQIVPHFWLNRYRAKLALSFPTRGTWRVSAICATSTMFCGSMTRSRRVLPGQANCLQSTTNKSNQTYWSSGKHSQGVFTLYQLYWAVMKQCCV